MTNDESDILRELGGVGPRPVSAATLARVRQTLQKDATVERPAKRASTPMLRVLAIVAACLLIALMLWRPWAQQPEILRIGNPPDIVIDTLPAVEPANATAGNGNRPPAVRQVVLGKWRITPTGAARYDIEQPNQVVQLSRGELLVESIKPKEDPELNQLARNELRITTPQANVIAHGTRFLVGTHVPFDFPPAKSSTGEEPMLKPITRVLVLAGTVTLANAAGTIDGGPGSLLAAEQDKAPTKLVVQANSDFGFDMYHELAKENEGKNLFFSPYSISTALAMTAEGARGETAQEMGKVLRYPASLKRVGDDAQHIPYEMSQIHTGMADLHSKLNGGEGDSELAQKTRARLAELRGELKEIKAQGQRLMKEGKWGEYRANINKEKPLVAEINKLAQTVDLYEIRVANALWGEQSYPFKKNYLDTVNVSYNTGGVFPVDFKTNFEGERVKINRWVEEQTKNRIKDLIPRGAVGKDTRLVLTNAIYFKGEWTTPFEKKLTNEQDFTLASGKKVKRQLMHAPALEDVRYVAFSANGTPVKLPGRGWGVKMPNYSFSAVELPYKGDDLSMVVIAPSKADGLEVIEKQLSTENLDRWINSMQKRKTHVHLPKFKQETDYKLTKTLPNMGMVRAFEDPRKPNGADFSGMTEATSKQDWLYISDVLHKAFVEVNEKGTEAAAATAVIMAVPTSAGPPPEFIPTFKADKPFIFLIREKSTDSILFLGRMMDPQMAK